MFLIWIARLVWIINEIDLINYTHQLGLCRSAMVLELSLVFSSSSFTPSTTNLLLNAVVKMWSHLRSSFPLQMQPPEHEACNLIRPTLPLKFQFLPAITFIYSISLFGIDAHLWIVRDIYTSHFWFGQNAVVEFLGYFQAHCGFPSVKMSSFGFLRSTSMNPFPNFFTPNIK